MSMTRQSALLVAAVRRNASAESKTYTAYSNDDRKFFSALRIPGSSSTTATTFFEIVVTTARAVPREMLQVSQCVGRSMIVGSRIGRETRVISGASGCSLVLICQNFVPA